MEAYADMKVSGIRIKNKNTLELNLTDKAIPEPLATSYQTRRITDDLAEIELDDAEIIKRIFGRVV
jgi:hypothetical protein